MTDTVTTCMGGIRRKRGISVARLASETGASRQTLYAIEAGNYVPNAALALRLARALEATVEELFRLAGESPAQMQTSTADFFPDEERPRAGQPVRLCRVGKRRVAVQPSHELWELPEADGVVIGNKGKVGLAGPETAEGGVLVAGCDPAMSILARRLQKDGVAMIPVMRNSSRALELLKGGWVHVAGTHLRDDSSVVRRMFAKDNVAVYSLAVWEQGIVVAKGNPKRISGIEDLARRDVSIVNRENGAGSRALLDAGMKSAGIPKKKVRGYGRIASGHLPAAWRVRTGEADCCIAPRAAARLYGLDFVSLTTERYDLVIRRESLALPGVARLLDALNRAAFRRALETLGGYDTK